MTTTIQGAVQPAHATFDQQRLDAIRETQRNAIASDLQQIQTDLRLDLLQEDKVDSVSRFILNWHQSITQLIADSKNPQEIYDDFKEQLKEGLVDSIFQSALDAQCLLGNDGETYTEKGLQVYRSMVPVQFQNRSPLHPEMEVPFETSPHVCARYMVAWLVSKKHNTPLRNAQNEILDKAYQELKDTSQKIAPPSIDQDEAIRQIMAHQAELEAQKERDRNARIDASRVKFENKLKSTIQPIAEKKFAEIRQKADQIYQKHGKEQENLNRRMNQQVEALQPVIDKIEQDIEDLKRRQQVNVVKKQTIKKGIDELHHTHQQLEAEKTKLQLEVKESQKAGAESLGSALITIGVCAFGTWAIKCAMEAAGGTGAAITVKPTPGGGFLEGIFKF